MYLQWEPENLELEKVLDLHTEDFAVCVDDFT